MAYCYNCFKRVLDLYLVFFLPIVMIFAFSVYVDRLFFLCLVPLSLLLGNKFEITVFLNTLSLFFLPSIFCVTHFRSTPIITVTGKEDYRGATEYLIQDAGSQDVLIFVSWARSSLTGIPAEDSTI